MDCDRPGIVDDVTEILKVRASSEPYATRSYQSAHDGFSLCDFRFSSTSSFKGLFDKGLLESTWLVSRRGGEAPRAIARVEGDKYKL